MGRAKRGIDEVDKENNLVGSSVIDVTSKRRKGANARAAPARSMATCKRRKGSKVGCLEIFLRLPFDVFEEIARNLSPGDLLSLARSTKLFRELFMSRASISTWHSAREAVGLPDCPDGISEPQFAEVLYGRGCMSCNSRQAKSVHFAFLKRLCEKCLYEYAVPGLFFVRNCVVGIHLEHQDARTICHLAPYYFPREVSSSDIENGLVILPKQEFLEVIENFSALHGDERKEYVETRIAYTTRVMEHVRLVEEWLKDQEIKKEEEKKAIGMKRRDTIITRLLELGYMDIDMNIYTSRWFALTEEPKELTERIWNRIKPELERIIDDHRREREERRKKMIRGIMSRPYSAPSPIPYGAVSGRAMTKRKR